MVLVTFQGEEGSYSEEALRAYFGARGMRTVEPMPCDDFDEAIQQVESGEAHYAFLPIENTLEGTVDEAVDVLLASDLFIVGEMRFKIEHCLIGHPGATVESIKTAFSHPYALRQSRDFLRAHNIRGVPASDTAGAVREVKARGDIMEAAVASRHAAEVHSMAILQRGIQSREHNHTRFLALSRSEYHPEPGAKEQYVTSLVFGCRNQPGALLACLHEFADRGINLLKLESRPRPERPWTYNFLVDFDGHREDEKVQEALAGLIGNTSSLQVLGSYPSWDWVQTRAKK